MIATRVSMRHQTAGFLFILLPLAAVCLGSLSAIQPEVALAIAGGLLVVVLTLVLPERLLLLGFGLMTLSGFRPLPPVLGFHIQAQFFLLPPLLLRALVDRDRLAAGDWERWRPLLVSAALLVSFSVIGLIEALGAASVNTIVLFGDYTAWLMAFMFLGVLVLLSRSRGRNFAETLYSALVTVLGVYAAITLVSGLLHFHSFQDASTARLSFADLNANQTGTLVVAGALMVIAPVTVDRRYWPRLFWLCAFLPLLVLTGSRDSLTALLFGLVLILLYQRHSQSGALYFYALATVASLVLIFITANQAIVPQSFLRSLNFPELTPYTSIFGFNIPHALAERLYIQSSALHQFLQSPLFGLGFQHSLYIPEGGNTSTWWGPLAVITVPHNAYLWAAVQGGLLGLGGFVLLIVTGVRMTGAALRTSIKNGSNTPIAIGVRCTLLTLLFISLNSDSFYADFKVMSLFLWLVVTAGLLTTPGPVAETARRARPVRPTAWLPPRSRPAPI